MNGKVNPEKMAGIYYSMLRSRAIPEVNRRIKEFEAAPETLSYWIVVRSLLEQCGKGKH